MKKPRSDSKLKTLPEDQQESIFEYLREHSHQETLDWLLTCGVDTSSAALTSFYQWYALKRRVLRAEAVKEQVRLEWVKENPDLDANEIADFFDTIFMLETGTKENVRDYTSVRRLWMEKRKYEEDLKQREEEKQRARETQEREDLTLEQKHSMILETFGIG